MKRETICSPDVPSNNNHQKAKNIIIQSDKQNVDLETKFINASKEGNINEIKYLLNEKKVDIGLEAQDQMTALHFAAMGGHVELVKYLLDEKKVDIGLETQSKRTALHFAAQGGHIKLVKYLLDEKKVSVNSEVQFKATALHYAAQGGHIELVKYLLDEKQVDIGLEAHGKITALHIAAMEGHVELIKYLLDEKKVNVNLEAQNQNTALHYAVMGGRIDLVKYLLDKYGLDINDLNKVIYSESPNVTSKAGIHTNQHENIVKYYLEHGGIVLEDQKKVDQYASLFHGAEVADIIYYDSDIAPKMESNISSEILVNRLKHMLIKEGIRDNTRAYVLTKYNKTISKELLSEIGQMLDEAEKDLIILEAEFISQRTGTDIMPFLDGIKFKADSEVENSNLNNNNKSEIQHGAKLERQEPVKADIKAHREALEFYSTIYPEVDDLIGELIDDSITSNDREQLINYAKKRAGDYLKGITRKDLLKDLIRDKELRKTFEKGVKDILLPKELKQEWKKIYTEDYNTFRTPVFKTIFKDMVTIAKVANQQEEKICSLEQQNKEMQQQINTLKELMQQIIFSNGRQFNNNEDHTEVMGNFNEESM